MITTGKTIGVDDDSALYVPERGDEIEIPFSIMVPNCTDIGIIVHNRQENCRHSRLIINTNFDTPSYKMYQVWCHECFVINADGKMAIYEVAYRLGIRALLLQNVSDASIGGVTAFEILEFFANANGALPLALQKVRASMMRI